MARLLPCSLVVEASKPREGVVPEEETGDREPALPDRQRASDGGLVCVCVCVCLGGGGAGRTADRWLTAASTSPCSGRTKRQCCISTKLSSPWYCSAFSAMGSPTCSDRNESEHSGTSPHALWLPSTPNASAGCSGRRQPLVCPLVSPMVTRTVTRTPTCRLQISGARYR